MDGRVLRGRRNRDSLVEAFLSLIEEGHERPTARAIAQRAGVSLRSVFQHFDELEQLYGVAGDRQLRKLRHLLEPVDPSLPLPQRLDELVRRRADLLDQIYPVARAARLREPFSDQLRANRAQMVTLLLEQCRSTLAPGLADLDGGAASGLLAAVGTAASWEAWYHLRNDLRMPAPDAQRVVRALVGGVAERSARHGALGMH